MPRLAQSNPRKMSPQVVGQMQQYMLSCKLSKKGKSASAKKSMIKLRTVLDNSGQFWTVLDKMLC
ncbi:MAG: hypothetical protein ACI4WX_13180, partial [Aristaeellaceae bacterium]